MQISADEVKNKVIQGMVDNLYYKDYTDNPEAIFKLIITHIEQKLNYKYDYSSVETLMKNMYDTIVMAILNIKTPKEEEKMKFYSSLLSIENWFIDLDTFESKMQEMYLLKTNIIKRVCYELGITQRELAERMKVNEVTVRQWSSKGEVMPNVEVTLNLLLENHRLKAQLKDLKSFAELIKSLQ